MKIVWKNQLNKDWHKGNRIQDNEISVSKQMNEILLSRALEEVLLEQLQLINGYGVEVFLSGNLVGLSPSDNKEKSFKIKNRRINLGKNTIKGAGRYYAYWNAEEEKVIIDLGEPSGSL